MIYNYQPLHGRYSAKEYFGSYRLNKLEEVNYDEYYRPDGIDLARSKAVIYHCYRWLGEFPWDKGNLHPFADIFDKYLSESNWSDYNKKRATTGIILKLEKILYRILPKRVFLRVFKKAHEMMLIKAENSARIMKTSRSA